MSSSGRCGSKGHVSRACLAAGLLCLLSSLAPAGTRPEGLATAPQPGPAAATKPTLVRKGGSLVIPPGAPPFFRHAFPAAMGSPRPKGPGSAVIPAVIPRTETDRDPSGLIGSANQDGPTTTEDNAFFQPLGLNGRTCASCHLPENGMSVSAAGIRDRYLKTQGRDPIFALVDGADCPNWVPGSETSPSLYFGGRLGKGHDLRGAYSVPLAETGGNPR